MAVPTIASVTPSTGPTGGWSLVEIVGTNFRLPPDPPPTGPVPVRDPTVAVTFGGVAARSVGVASAERLVVVTDGADPGTVDVVVKNLDDDGVPIAGEVATLDDGFVYALPVLAEESDFGRLVRAFIQEWKRQVIAEVALVTHTDFSDDPASGLAAVAQLPAIILSGPSLAENRLHSLHEQQTVQAVSTFDRMKTPRTVDLTFGVVGVSDSNVELLSLLASSTLMLHRTRYLRMLRDASDPNAGWVEYEMAFAPGGEFKVATTPNNANVRNFTGSVTVRGFDFEGYAGMDGDFVAGRGGRVAEDGVIIQTEQTGPSYPVGPSPGEGGDA